MIKYFNFWSTINLTNDTLGTFDECVILLISVANFFHIVCLLMTVIAVESQVLQIKICKEKHITQWAIGDDSRSFLNERLGNSFS